MKTCKTCKFKGEEIIDYASVSCEKEKTGYFLCERIKHDESYQRIKGQKALVQDGSGYYAALCVEDDFGCTEWEE